MPFGDSYFHLDWRKSLILQGPIVQGPIKLILRPRKFQLLFIYR